MCDFSTVKRSRKSVSLEIKYNIIKLADSGESNTKIARKLELPRTTVVSIMKDKARILEEVRGQAPMHAKYIRQRAGLIAEMEKLLIVWLDDQTRCHVPVSPAVIQTKARSLFEYLKSRHGDGSQEETFQASKGWFKRFKSRFNLHNIREPCDAASMDEEAASEFPRRLAEVNEGRNCTRQGRKIILKCYEKCFFSSTVVSFMFSASYTVFLRSPSAMNL